MENYLVHHGVEGQQKGHRQYQYPDGSLTPLGRKHYGVGPARDSTRRKAILNAGRGYVDNVGKSFKTFGKQEATYGYKAGVKKLTKDWSEADFKRENKKNKERNKYMQEQAAAYQAQLDSKMGKIDVSRDIAESTARSLGDLSPYLKKTIYSGQDPKELSNKELQDFITRANLEAQYIRLNTKELDTAASKGTDIAREILQTVGTVIGVAGGILYLREAAKRL